MPFGSLWLPVVVSAVAVWLLSALLHMVLRYHRADYKRLPDEDSVAQALRPAGLAPGYYVMPYAMGPGQMKDPADPSRGTRRARSPCSRSCATARRRWASTSSSGSCFCLLASFVTAYVARHTLSLRERRPGGDAVTGTSPSWPTGSATSRTRSGGGSHGRTRCAASSTRRSTPWPPGSSSACSGRQPEERLIRGSPPAEARAIAAPGRGARSPRRIPPLRAL